MNTLYVTLIGRVLGYQCNAGPCCPWCQRADTATHHQLEAHAYPGQPTHHSAPPIRPCTCAYHVMNTPADGYLVVPSYRSPFSYNDTGHEDDWTYAVWYPRCPVLSWFTIRRTCPHHGWQ